MTSTFTSNTKLSSFDGFNLMIIDRLKIELLVHSVYIFLNSILLLAHYIVVIKKNFLYRLRIVCWDNTL